MNYIRKNVELVKEKIASTCGKIKIDPSCITLVCVTKERSQNEIMEAYSAGLRVFGENRIQEALTKFEKLNFQAKTEFHMIGHLQTNKVKDAVSIFDMIQSIDSLRLLEKIEEEAQKQNRRMRVLVQINVSKDPKKFGIMQEEILEFFKQANSLLFSEWISIEGLMTIVEHTKNIEARKPFFRQMKRIFDDLKSLLQEGRIENIEMKYLSMGMSEDFEIAIEEGANMIRVGRAVFEMVQ